MTAAEEEYTDRQLTEIVHIPAAGVFIHANPYAILLNFTAAESAGRDEGLVERHVATVQMSPQLAKALVQILVTTIANYEDALGEIPLPPELSDIVRIELLEKSTSDEEVTSS